MSSAVSLWSAEQEIDKARHGVGKINEAIGFTQWIEGEDSKTGLTRIVCCLSIEQQGILLLLGNTKNIEQLILNGVSDPIHGRILH